MDDFTFEHIVRVLGDKKMTFAELAASVVSDLCDMEEWQVSALKAGWTPPTEWLRETRTSIASRIRQAVDLGQLVVTTDWKVAVPRKTPA